MRAGRLNDIVILRSISILLVVFVHSFYIYNYGSLSDIDTIVIKIERFFNLDILNKEEFYKLKYCSTVVYMVPRA